ncbi:UvrB/UvrC motif-containing protein [Clostridium sp. MSJ-11]|uniref:UvrB/UvrC motif-containing protein n=1 Tax=Clostridium mobile TaxID=2841512 RepID=A0ABS6EIG5_9CLOT|nr:UvrB/UvrC motif-containing protein [Clostridium mobile]MBU5484999.1 UvrB/UvrC motif-containing protein [Clostridium mobile]
MLCERCKKNDANVHLTQIVNSVKSQLNLCEKCAKEMGGFDLPVDIDFSSPFTFQNILSGIMDYINQPLKQEDNISLTCNNCGTNYGEFKNKGLVGCSECYTNLNNTLMSVIKRVQGNVEHVGKIPKRAGKSIIEVRKINNLKEELKNAIEKEEYEKAAELRDIIKGFGKEKGEEV